MQLQLHQHAMMVYWSSQPKELSFVKLEQIQIYASLQKEKKKKIRTVLLIISLYAQSRFDGFRGHIKY